MCGPESRRRTHSQTVRAQRAQCQLRADARLNFDEVLRAQVHDLPPAGGPHHSVAHGKL